MAEKDYELISKDDIKAEAWLPDKDFSVKEGDTVNGTPVFMGALGPYVKDLNRNVFYPGDYMLPNNEWMSKADFETKYKEKIIGP